MQNFRNLRVWRDAHETVLAVYRSSARFPKDEQYGLTSQLRRAAMSVALNLAEGCARGTDPDFARFVRMAMGSASETEYASLLAFELGYMTQENHEELEILLLRTRKQLNALIKRLQKGTSRVGEN
jgi:four helix bundle protein